MYQALYRKWRPQTFDDVIGQQHITETLKNQVKTGRLSHAYIFIGTRGTGKTTCARILAKAVNCEQPVNGNPCGVCAACRSIAEGNALDVVELDAASNNGVDNVRALREEAIFSPASVKKRVYIIDEVHMLSLAAFNSLLKILEEPPEHLMFILATTELQKVPATILSRCQRHSFKRIDTGVIAEYLEHIARQEHFDMSHDAAELIARLAEGGVRDALSLLDQCSAADKIDVESVYSTMGLAGNRRVAELLGLILDKEVPSVLDEFSAMWMDGKAPATLLGELSTLLRDVLMFHAAPNSAVNLVSGGYDRATLQGFARELTTEELLCMLDTVQRALNGMRDAPNPKTAAELCLISLCDNTMGESAANLRARISRLEEQVKNGFPKRREHGHGEDGEFDMPRTERDMEPEYEDIDPAEFAEEQPEDAFLDRPRAEVPAAVSQPAAVRNDSPGISDAELWSALCEKVKNELPKDIQIHLSAGNAVRGVVQGNILRIEAAPGFVFGRFNRQDILKKFADAAGRLVGREMNAVLAELREEERPVRSLDELKNFKEVRFI